MRFNEESLKKPKKKVCQSNALFYMLMEKNAKKLKSELKAQEKCNTSFNAF
jgi:hypothetical protein